MFIVRDTGPLARRREIRGSSNSLLDLSELCAVVKEPKQSLHVEEQALVIADRTVDGSPQNSHSDFKSTRQEAPALRT